MIDVDKLTEFVRNNIRPLCERFYPDGKLEGHEWRCADVTGKAGNSFAIELEGPKAGLCNDRGGSFSGNFTKALGAKLGLKFPQAVNEIERAFGISFLLPFDWNSYADPLSTNHRKRLSEDRAYSPFFVGWLVKEDMIRASSGNNGSANWVFPIRAEGEIVGAHCRPVEWPPGDKKHAWFVYPPKGAGIKPLIVGRLDQAEVAHLSESTWDMLTVCDKLKIHQTSRACAIATRGAANTKFGRVIPKGVARVYLWEQNDGPGRKWTSNICEELPEAASVFVVATPAEHADVNDWTRAGATAADLLKAIESAKQIECRNENKTGTGEPETKQDSEASRSEHELACTFAKNIPPLRCVGELWYIYKNGCWQPAKREIYRPLALSIQTPGHQTERKARAVISHVESVHQFDDRSFRSFYYLGGTAEIYINCANTVLCITRETVSTLTHSADFNFTKQLSANYQPRAKAETFARVLLTALPDPEDRLLFKNFAGSLLLPDSRFEAVLVYYGQSGTSKSTLAEGIRAALGPDVITNLTLHQICDPRCFHLNKLRLAAVNISTELNAIAVSSENFKRLSSGEAIDADQKYRDSITLETACKLWFLTNDLPKFESGSDAELRRLRFLRFFHRVSETDPTLKAKIRFEADGILNFMISGLQDLLGRNEMPLGSKQSIETRERFRLQNDSLGTFVETECELDPGCEEIKDHVESAFADFCKDNGIPNFKDSSHFFRKLYGRFPVRPYRPRQGGERLQKIKGIRLKDDE